MLVFWWTCGWLCHAKQRKVYKSQALEQFKGQNKVSFEDASESQKGSCFQTPNCYEFLDPSNEWRRNKMKSSACLHSWMVNSTIHSD